MPSQILLPAWTPVRNASVFASLLVQDPPSPSHPNKKLSVHVNLLLKDDESTQSDDESTQSDGEGLIARTSQNPLTQPTKDLILHAVNKARVLQSHILDLRCLLSDLQSRHAALNERTYTRRWHNPWPASLRAAYSAYKKDDLVWRDLRKRFAKHCATYRDIRPGSPLFSERLRITMKLGDAAIRTSRGRLQFLDKYMCSFAEYGQVGTHIYEGAQALRSAELAMRELYLMLNLFSIR